MEVVIGNSSELIAHAQTIRQQVFVIEQNIPQALDLDGLDESSSHALVKSNGSLVATARLSHIDTGHAVMARVAVLEEFRGSGVASKIVNAVMAYARKSGVRSIEIHAHQYLRAYYEKFGFQFIRDVEVVGEHQLIEMRCQLAQS